MHEFFKLANKRSKRGIAFKLMTFSLLSLPLDINMFTYAASIETLSAVSGVSCFLFRNYADISSERPKNFFFGGTRISVF